MRLIDADELNGHACERYQANGVELETIMMVPLSVINKAPTIDIETQLLGAELHGIKLGYEEAQKKMMVRPQGECKYCKYRDPEDKKCDCGAMERQGCIFPVSDNYCCKYYEPDQNDFVSSPTEVVKVGEPLPNSDEINKALEKGEMYKQGFKEGYKQAIIDGKTNFSRPKGKWVKIVDGTGFVSHVCSECGAEIELEDCSDDKFCFNCGADMRGNENETY